MFANFIGLDLESCIHNVEIIYEVKGIKIGVLVRLVSLVFL